MIAHPGFVVRDAQRCRAPHHEGLEKPHPEEAQSAVSKDEATALENDLALARRFQTLEQQRQQGVDPHCELWLAPFLGMGWMMEAAGGVENRARRGFHVGDLEHAL